jgi:hypothetical protein
VRGIAERWSRSQGGARRRTGSAPCRPGSTIMSSNPPIFPVSRGCWMVPPRLDPPERVSTGVGA